VNLNDCTIDYMCTTLDDRSTEIKVFLLLFNCIECKLPETLHRLPILICYDLIAIFKIHHLMIVGAVGFSEGMKLCLLIQKKRFRK
jgi:hypothetical protein